MEASELEKILTQAHALAKKHKITLEEALLLMAVHEVVCIHFHVDQVLSRASKGGERAGPVEKREEQ